MDVAVKFERVFHGGKPRPAEYHGLCAAIELVHHVKAAVLDYDGSAVLSIVQVGRGMHSQGALLADASSNSLYLGSTQTSPRVERG